MAEAQNSDAFCRDCLTPVGSGPHCAACGSPRILRHAELHRLAIAHLDCDAFYAAVEKRDDPSLNDKPVIIGGGRRGVVSTACYIARIHGVHSAQPMFKALRACPDAVVIKPNMKKYGAVSRQVRSLMDDVTPVVQPISIDEAFLDLTGTERLHGRSAAVSLAALARKIERELGITASIGLSHNKFLAKVASDLEKPRGFSIIGRTETLAFLRRQPVSIIWGVGRALRRKLEKDGIRTVGHLQELDETTLMKRYGVIGQRLHRLARGQDSRAVSDRHKRKSVSSETTFAHDLIDFSELETRLWRQCERVSAALKSKGMAGRTVTLKLKTGNHRIVTRSRTLDQPTQLANVIFEETRSLLKNQATGTPYRLIGAGVSDLSGAEDADQPDLIAEKRTRLNAAERAMDRVRDKFGRDALIKGRAMRR